MSRGPQGIWLVANVPDRSRTQVEWICSQASIAWGIPIRVDFDAAHAASADIFYSGMPTESGATWWPFNDRCYNGDHPFQRSVVNGRPVWSDGQAEPDLLGGAYRLLTLVDETQVSAMERNDLGIFNTPALPSERRSVLDVPLVDIHLDALWEQVQRIRPDLQQAPRWPNGKRWVCLLTHDTDAVSLGRIGELTYNAAKLLVRGDRTRLRMISAGLWNRRSPMQDPFFGFPAWRLFEEARGIRSAFYLFARHPATRRHFHDSRSSVLDPGIDPRIFRALADEGWEFGLHASINARHAEDGLRKSHDMLEEWLERPITGLRHHYWALDWLAPWRTFKEQAAAGFRYDASLAWRDVPGLRAGTCLPFRPLDVESGQVLKLWALPTAIMDGHVVGVHAGKLEDAVRLIDEIRSVGGVLVLNWHTEFGAGHFGRGHLPMLERILQHVGNRSDVWFTTPNELLDRWEMRERQVGLTGVAV